LHGSTAYRGDGVRFAGFTLGGPPSSREASGTAGNCDRGRHAGVRSGPSADQGLGKTRGRFSGGPAGGTCLRRAGHAELPGWGMEFGGWRGTRKGGGGRPAVATGPRGGGRGGRPPRQGRLPQVGTVTVGGTGLHCFQAFGPSRPGFLAPPGQHAELRGIPADKGTVRRLEPAFCRRGQVFRGATSRLLAKQRLGGAGAGPQPKVLLYRLLGFDGRAATPGFPQPASIFRFPADIVLFTTSGGGKDRTGWRARTGPLARCIFFRVGGSEGLAQGFRRGSSAEGGSGP